VRQKFCGTGGAEMKKLRTTRNTVSGAITVEGDTFRIVVAEDGRVTVFYPDRTVELAESLRRCVVRKTANVLRGEQ
jgi:hypothetical protein